MFVQAAFGMSGNGIERPDSHISATRHFHHFDGLGSRAKQEGNRNEPEKIVQRTFERS
jgi:hypothetical protein